MNGRFSDMDPMSDAGWISAKLNAVRRRLFLVLFANSLCMAACGLVFLWVLFSVFFSCSFGPASADCGRLGVVYMRICRGAHVFFQGAVREGGAKFLDSRLKLGAAY